MTDSIEIPKAILGFSTMPNFYSITCHSSRNIKAYSFLFRRPYCYFRLSLVCCYHLETLSVTSLLSASVFFVTCITTILILVLFSHFLVNLTIKFRQFQKNYTSLTSCQITSCAPIGDLIVAFCTHFIFMKSHERAAPNAEQTFCTDSKT